MVVMNATFEFWSVHSIPHQFYCIFISTSVGMGVHILLYTIHINTTEKMNNKNVR